MRSITKLSLVAVLALTGTALQAQSNNASITATASVQTPINVLGAQPLSFGNVFPGVNKTVAAMDLDRKSTRLNSSHSSISYAVFCLKKKSDYAEFTPQYKLTSSTNKHTR